MPVWCCCCACGGKKDGITTVAGAFTDSTGNLLSTIVKRGGIATQKYNTTVKHLDSQYDTKRLDIEICRLSVCLNK